MPGTVLSAKGPEAKELEAISNVELEKFFLMVYLLEYLAEIRKIFLSDSVLKCNLPKVKKYSITDTLPALDFMSTMGLKKSRLASKILDCWAYNTKKENGIY